MMRIERYVREREANNCINLLMWRAQRRVVYEERLDLRDEKSLHYVVIKIVEPFTSRATYSVCETKNLDRIWGNVYNIHIRHINKEWGSELPFLAMFEIHDPRTGNMTKSIVSRFHMMEAQDRYTLSERLIRELWRDGFKVENNQALRFTIDPHCYSKLCYPTLPIVIPCELCNKEQEYPSDDSVDASDDDFELHSEDVSNDGQWTIKRRKIDTNTLYS